MGQAADLGHRRARALPHDHERCGRPRTHTDGNGVPISCKQTVGFKLAPRVCGEGQRLHAPAHLDHLFVCGSCSPTRSPTRSPTHHRLHFRPRARLGLRAAYYRGANGILLVYDITDEASFNNIRNWMHNIQQHATDNVNKVREGCRPRMRAGDCRIRLRRGWAGAAASRLCALTAPRCPSLRLLRQILVGNKSDMGEEKRVVSYRAGQELAAEYGIQFFETSAKDNVNVEEVGTGVHYAGRVGPASTAARREAAGGAEGAEWVGEEAVARRARGGADLVWTGVSTGRHLYGLSEAHALTRAPSFAAVQVFAAVAKEVVQRLTKEQEAQVEAQQPAPVNVAGGMDGDGSRQRRGGCC